MLPPRSLRVCVEDRRKGRCAGRRRRGCSRGPKPRRRGGSGSESSSPTVVGAVRRGASIGRARGTRSRARAHREGRERRDLDALVRVFRRDLPKHPRDRFRAIFALKPRWRWTNSTRVRRRHERRDGRGAAAQVHAGEPAHGGRRSDLLQAMSYVSIQRKVFGRQVRNRRGAKKYLKTSRR